MSYKYKKPIRIIRFFIEGFSKFLTTRSFLYRQFALITWAARTLVVALLIPPE